MALGNYIHFYFWFRCSYFQRKQHETNNLLQVATFRFIHSESIMETARTMNSVNNADNSAAGADQKILNDLDLLIEKMDQCQTKLTEQKGNSNVFSTTNELYDIIGFLEACAPRMVELVEFCATQPSGNTATAPLSDIVLMKALDVNDRLIKTLSDLDHLTFQSDNTDVDVPSEESTQPPSRTLQQSTSEDEFDAFLSVRTNETSTTNDDLLS